MLVPGLSSLGSLDSTATSAGRTRSASKRLEYPRMSGRFRLPLGLESTTVASPRSSNTFARRRESSFSLRNDASWPSFSTSVRNSASAPLDSLVATPGGREYFGRVCFSAFRRGFSTMSGTLPGLAQRIPICESRLLMEVRRLCAFRCRVTPWAYARALTEAPQGQEVPGGPEQSRPARPGRRYRCHGRGTHENPAAVALGRMGGLKGGKARAESMTAKQRTASAKKAAKARWGT